MIAAVTDNAGNVVAVHRTYLAYDGRKAEIQPIKATLALLLGGAIRMQPIEPGKPLVIGEGIESSASAGRLLGAPAWSAVSSANLRHSLILLPEAKRIIVAADPDDPGKRAAIGAALRYSGARTMASETGAIFLFGEEPAPDPEPSPGFTIEEFNVRAPEHSDEALALRFADRHADELRYVALWGKWMVLQPTHWRPDETLLPFDLARTICREAAAECDKPQAGKQVASGRTVAAVEKLARADRRHAATVDQWDRDPWALNTPDGIVDLRTGDLRPCLPEDFVTKRAAVSLDGECRLWLRFLDQVTAGDKELQSFLQRLAGYCLTGLTIEHALFFVYGPGGNGKGVFLNKLSAILTDYAAISPMETFTASHSDRHPTELAMLRGARMVVSQETEQGRAWAESKVKAMTGDLSARFMRQDFFTFTPHFKLVIAGNHKPVLHSVDEAIRRRFYLIPLKVTIPAAERNPNLAEDLKVEWPAILQWAIIGCLEWQAIGLAPPSSVLDATDEYLAGEDSLGQWIAECCDLSGDDRQRLARLLGMCGSNSDNEALAAARLADKLIRQRHATWFDAVGAEPPKPEPDDDADQFAAWGGWRAAARCAALDGGDVLSEWERRFAMSLTGFVRTRDKQLSILGDLCAKLELAGCAP